MRKIKFLLLSLTVLAATNSFAQDDKKEDGPAISIGAEVGIPLGDLKTTYSVGIGGSVKAAIPVFEGGAFTINAGYMTFSGKSFQTLTGFDANLNPIYGSAKLQSLGMIPIKAGLRFSISEGFYGEPQLGYTLYSGSGSSGAFTYAANLGYVINKMVDISARYEAASKNSSTLSFIGARVAYSFGL